MPLPILGATVLLPEVGVIAGAAAATILGAAVTLGLRTPAVLSETAPVAFSGAEGKQLLAWFGASTYQELAKDAAKSIIAYWGLIAFVEFIYEESIQASLFPVFPLVQSKKYAAARRQLEVGSRIVELFSGFMSTVGKTAPLTEQAFNTYLLAAQEQIKGYYEVVGETERTGTTTESKTLPNTGTVFLDSVPTRAQIYRDGVYTRNLTPETYTLPAGFYTFEIRRSGYKSATFTVSLDAGGSVTKVIDLERGTGTTREPGTTQGPAPQKVIENVSQLLSLEADTLVRTKSGVVWRTLGRIIKGGKSRCERVDERLPFTCNWEDFVGG